MFEEKTYEAIMAEMMMDAPGNISTAEGSLFYNACAKQAARLEEAYAIMEGVNNNMNVETADLEHLTYIGSDRGCEINPATYAEFEAQFNCAVADGAEFNLDEYNYTVFSCIDSVNHKYIVGVDTPGVAPNIMLGDLEPIEFIDGFEWGRLLKCIKEGQDEEDEDSYRARLLNTFDYRGFAGNREYYLTRIKEISGVTACRVYRVKAPTDNIKCVIAGAQFKNPGTPMIESVQTAIDPIVNSGEGDGIAPIGHRVTVEGVTEVDVNINTKITYEPGKSYADLKTYIEAEIDKYLLTLRKTWESSENIVVRVLQIEAAIVAIEGIVDVAETTINGVASNLQITGDNVPVKGVVTCS